MTDKAIELRIREYYVADTGEWLVEKGKVKEAKLLKEACETIERLRRENARLWQTSHEESRKAYDKAQELEKREKNIADTETRLRERIWSAKTGLQHLLERM